MTEQFLLRCILAFRSRYDILRPLTQDALPLSTYSIFTFKATAFDWICCRRSYSYSIWMYICVPHYFRFVPKLHRTQNFNKVQLYETHFT